MEDANQTGISIEDIIKVIKKRWFLIICLILLTTAISIYFTFYVVKPKYQASTKIFIGKQSDTTKDGYDYSEVEMYKTLMKTYAELFKTKNLIRESVSSLNLDNSIDAIISNLQVTPISESQILKVEYIDKSPMNAKLILETISRYFVITSNELVPNSKIKIVEDVESQQQPISPNKSVNIVVGILLGCILGLGLALFLEVIDNTFSDADSFEKEFKIPVLGSVPKTD